MRTYVRNVSGAPVTLPYPLSGIVPAGKGVTLGLEVEMVASFLGALGRRGSGPLRLEVAPDSAVVDDDYMGVSEGSSTAPFVWDDLRFPASASNPIGAGTGTADFNADTGVLEFGGTAREYAAVQVQTPHDRVVGSPLFPHVHWVQEAAGDVLWRLEYQILGRGGTVGATYPDWTVVDTVDPAGVFTWTSGWLHQVHTFPAIEVPEEVDGVSVMFNMRISRQGPEPEDTMSAQAGLLEFDLHYQRDPANLGSLVPFPGYGDPA